ncbi:MAG: flagellar motor protein MotB [Pirellulales bacterium]
MAGKGGGAWKVAYADFVTAMMAFFLVMWITSQSKPVKEAISQYFSDPWGNSSTPSSSQSIIPRRDRSGAPPIIGPHKGGLGRGRGTPKPAAKSAANAEQGRQSGSPSLVVLQEAGQSHVGAVLKFSEYSAELDEVAQSRLEELAPLMLGKPNKIEIRGHASKRPLPKESGFKDPWEISYARCLGTMKYLLSKGVAADRIRLSQAGPFEPQSLELEADWPGLNSRVDVYMLGEFVDDFQGSPDARTKQTESPRKETQ